MNIKNDSSKVAVIAGSNDHNVTFYSKLACLMLALASMCALCCVNADAAKIAASVVMLVAIGIFLRLNHFESWRDMFNIRL